MSACVSPVRAFRQPRVPDRTLHATRLAAARHIVELCARSLHREPMNIWLKIAKMSFFASARTATTIAVITHDHRRINCRL
eukprot:6213734-Pleurochrysis_carterae.AAC.5